MTPLENALTSLRDRMDETAQRMFERDERLHTGAGRFIRRIVDERGGLLISEVEAEEHGA